MTTSFSPLPVLRRQADTIAGMLKAFERGDKIDVHFAAKLEAARGNESFKFGIVMDDKVVTVEMTWAALREYSQVALAEFILKQMRLRDAVN